MQCLDGPRGGLRAGFSVSLVSLCDIGSGRSTPGSGPARQSPVRACDYAGARRLRARGPGLQACRSPSLAAHGPGACGRPQANAKKCKPIFLFQNEICNWYFQARQYFIVQTRDSSIHRTCVQLFISHSYLL
jgi:hypothetical protein